jgi:hypothetical protein
MNHGQCKIRSSYTIMLALLAVVALSMLPGRASADLLDRGPDMVYDDVLNITWTRNASLLGTNLDWLQASNAAAALVLDGYSGWQLATVSTTSPIGSVFDCSTGTASACASAGNQLGYMFYHNLGGTFFQDKTGTQTSLLGGQVLTGIQPQSWASTESSTISAWAFYFNDGAASPLPKSVQVSAWAVYSGDVAAVPEPETYAMMLAGLGLMGFVARRRRQKEAA